MVQTLQYTATSREYDLMVQTLQYTATSREYDLMVQTLKFRNTYTIVLYNVRALYGCQP